MALVKPTLNGIVGVLDFGDIESRLNGTVRVDLTAPVVGVVGTPLGQLVDMHCIGGVVEYFQLVLVVTEIILGLQMGGHTPEPDLSVVLTLSSGEVGGVVVVVDHLLQFQFVEGHVESVVFAGAGLELVLSVLQILLLAVLECLPPLLESDLSVDHLELGRLLLRPGHALLPGVPREGLAPDLQGSPEEEVAGGGVELELLFLLLGPDLGDELVEADILDLESLLLTSHL